MKQLSLIAQWPASLLDRLNDRLTSYRLMLYLLTALVGWAAIGGLVFSNKVPYSASQILFSALWLLAVCWLANKLIAKFLDIPANKESDLITALILALILTPAASGRDYAVLAAAGIAAIASKYVITFNKSHIFNPAAAGAFIAGEVLHKYPAWWVGTKFITPLVVVGGLLVLRKMKRFSLVFVFLAAWLLGLIYLSNNTGLHSLWLELISTQILFFAVVMLTEPLTSPTIAKWFIPYGVVVAIGYSVIRLRLSPEAALLIGNLFTFIVARNRRYQLKFIRKVQEAEGIFSYIFSMPPRFRFAAGQYMEWTIAQNKTDSRGNRRYLTISSAPTEPGLMFTIKHPNPASAFKQKLDELAPGDTILASHLAGSFTLPNDASKKIALLAGGVGITPFRSMVKYLIDSGQKRDVALMYSANSERELSFRPLFAKAANFGLKSFYLTNGRINEALIQTVLPDFKDRRFYISGPYPFVHAAQTALLKLGVNPGEIVTDYFPGYGG